MAVAPSDGNRIYTGSLDGQVRMTTDGGNTWTEIDTAGEANTSLPGFSIQTIAVSPTNPNSILVGFSGSGTSHLWACTNTNDAANLTWNSVSGPAAGVPPLGPNDLPDASLNTIAIDIDDPVNTYYVGTDVGVFQTLDGGNTWQNATNPLSLPNVQVNVLKVVPGTRYLHAATYGRGIWRIKLNTAIQSLTLNPASPVVGGTQVTGTVTISDPALPGGFSVTLGSDNVRVAAPTTSSLTIPAGQTSAQFAINTALPVNPSSIVVSLSATANKITRSASLTVQNFATPHLLFSAAWNRTPTGIVVTLTATNNGAAAANSVTVTVGTLRDRVSGVSSSGTPLPLNFGNLSANGGMKTLTLTFPGSTGVAGDLALLRLQGAYQQAAPANGSGSCGAGIQHTLP